MQIAPDPEDEAARIHALREYQILDSGPEESFNDLTRLAAYICETPVAGISLIDSDRQWFKAKVGITESETSRDISFCSHAILQDGPFIVADALEDDRFKANPLVTAQPNIRFYAGSPLVSPEGYKIGTLCVIDSAPRELNLQQVAALRVISNQIITLLEHRRDLTVLREVVAKQRKERDDLKDRLQRYERR